MKLIAHSQLDELIAKASSAARGRAHLPVHASADDPVQRFFVAARQESYFRPHRHLTRSELAVGVRGRLDVVTFDSEGRVVGRYGIGEGADNLGYEAANGTWHTLVALTEDCVFFEVKQGPYDPATSVDFAPWAPAEGEATVARYQRWLRDAGPGSIFSG
jgi:cupin fold WbuC family metalloprotein